MFKYLSMSNQINTKKAVTVWISVLIVIIGLQSINVSSQSDEIDYTNLIRGNYDSEFAKVYQARDFIFPEDHGSHENYRIEWWYITGNLSEENSPENRWGYQITFFRFALAPQNKQQIQTDWQSNHIYAAHFAVTDFQHKKHFQFERFSRPALDLAGVTHTPFVVWLDNWTLSSQSSDYFPLKLSTLATDTDFGTVALDLSLTSQKPLVLQGENGFSPKSQTPGNASHYYSYTRLESEGKITVGEKTFLVEGSSWLDREWGSSSLDDNQTGWDWFALQFDDNQELMYYRLRTNNAGENNQHSSSRGVWVNSDGTHITLGPKDVNLSPVRYWQYNGITRYPVQWKLTIPKLGVDLNINAAIDDQLWKSQLRYWEGAMDVSGTHNGRGYLELSGY